MYRSLYGIIKPKVETGQSGILWLLHASRRSAAMEFKSGQIVNIIQGDTEGLEAAKVFVRWISVADIFLSGETLDISGKHPIDTRALLMYLKRIDGWVPVFNKEIGGCDAIFEFVGHEIVGSQNFSPQELSVSLLMDGKTSLKAIHRKSGLNELDTLIAIHKFIQRGLIKTVESHQSMSIQAQPRFLGKLSDLLSDITGPVATVLIEEGFKAIGSPPEELAECDIPLLLAVIAFNLEKEEKEAFTRWARSYM